MQYTPIQIGLLAANALYVLWFGLQYIQAFNYEFIAYAVLIVIIFALLYGTLHITKFPTTIIIGLTVWGLLHMMGGTVQVGEGVLYAYRIYPFYDGGGDFYILKMDQVVHAFLYGVVALMFLHLLRRIIQIRTHRILVALIAVLAATGLSVLNEIIEFAAVVALPETGVGGYENTVLDLIFNLSGAIVAVISYIAFNKSKS